MTDGLEAEDAKLVTLARGARGRVGAASGAAVRDETGRTYSGADVILPSLSISSLALAVAQAVAAGARGAEAAVVVGPDNNNYVIDHHHLARALHEEGEKDVLVSVVADLTMVDKKAFWVVLDNHRWVYPYDAKGERRDYGDLPKDVTGLKDDPFRSLAGELRRAGGFAKDTTPFSEFLWADFLRRRMSRKTVDNDFEKALEQALSLGKSRDAIYLPGWCGPADED